MSEKSVKLYIYEISNGLARQMSPLLLGKQIDGIWHTGVVCFGREFFFGSGGIDWCLPCGTMLGEPDRIIDLGETQIPEELFTTFLQELGANTFSPDKYHLFNHNCNHFSNELTLFLTGKKIPKQIRSLPHEIANSSFGQMIKPIIDSMTVTPARTSSASGGRIQSSAQARNPNTRSTSSTSSSVMDPESIFEPRDNSHQASSSSTTSQSRIPSPMYFQSKDVQQDIKLIREAFAGSKDERRVAVVLNEIEKLLIKGKSVTLKDDFISCIECIFRESYGKESKVNVLELLKALSLEKAFVNHSKVLPVLCSVISNLLDCVSKKDTSTAVASIHVLCNFTSTKTGHDLLMNNKEQSRITSVLTTCLLEEDNVSLCKAASELAFNVARYKISDETAFECATAILEVTNRKLDTDTVYNLLFAFCEFMKCSTEVSSLAQALGTDVTRYVGQSEDIDQLCYEIKSLMKQ